MKRIPLLQIQPDRRGNQCQVRPGAEAARGGKVSQGERPGVGDQAV